jgi:PqqD family protein of HPr-rel-A system
LPPGVSLSWRQWEPDEAIVFNRASGGTHLLDAFSAAALRLLAEQPRGIMALSRQLADESGAEEKVVSARLGEILNTLRTLGLAEPVSPCDSAS